jgi:hypothetical protein
VNRDDVRVLRGEGRDAETNGGRSRLAARDDQPRAPTISHRGRSRRRRHDETIHGNRRHGIEGQERERARRSKRAPSARRSSRASGSDDDERSTISP